jgi:hypothetical protein
VPETVPRPDTTSRPPLLTVAATAVPPDSTNSLPPPETVVLEAVPPTSTSSKTPLLTANPDSAWLEPISRMPPALILVPD